MDKTEIIKSEAEELLKKMINSCELNVEAENDVYHIVIKTEEEASTVIGRHGETIRAIQKILEVILYKKIGEPVSLLVNVNDYREKQKERLEGIADSMAQKVLDEKREMPLRSLSSYERKMIHEYIASKYPDLTSYSVGEGRDRQLMIAPKGEEKEKTESSEKDE
ncbi:KH domain-containing protein [Candidatus Roizmanbacteria bacterium]|nr:KH domain-containing protein [Candidatus Roizmanbacteria bacterium]